MGVITLTLIIAGWQSSANPDPQTWVVFACGITIALGTYMGGWRIIRTLGTGKALVDLRLMAPLSAEEQQWVAANWLPRAVVQGNYRYGAVLSNPGTAPWLRPEDQPLLDWPQAPTYCSFADEAEARAWLRQQIVVGSHI